MKYLFVLTLTFFLAQCNSRTIVKSGLEGRPMASFSLLLMDGITKVNTNDIQPGMPTVFLFISPYCPYCRAQTEEIVKNVQSFSDIQIFILSDLPISDMKEFADYYHLGTYKNITVGQDYSLYFANYFRVPGIPFIAIYDKNKILKEVLMGKASIRVIKDAAVR